MRTVTPYGLKLIDLKQHHRSRRLSILALVMALLSVSCGEDAPARDTWLSGLGLQSASPQILLPGSHIQLVGTHFVDSTLGTSSLRLRGTLDDQPVDLRIPGLEFFSFETMEVVLDASIIAEWPRSRGEFQGVAWIDVVTSDSQVYKSPELTLSFDLRESLSPTIDSADSGAIVYVNDRISVQGSDFFLEPSEGQTFALVEGCFRPRGKANCDPVPSSEILVSEVSDDRRIASFPLLPSVAGIASGVFEGSVGLRNVHAGDDTVAETDELAVSYELLSPVLLSVETEQVSLGKFVDFAGGGFVDGDLDGGTELLVRGLFVPQGAPQGVSVDLVLVPDFVDGRKVRYVINEDDELGRALGSRQVTGRFDGDLRVRVSYKGQEEVGEAEPFGFDLQPIEQVVFLNFLPDYVNSLRHFGLRAIDSQIRERVAAVVRRDYAGVNLDVRIEEPNDFALYSIVDILGQDLNGLGLLGYDNTSGKDVDNVRLFDHIGGVNAVTQQDGFPGFGGVFIESLFAFSEHPKGRATRIGDGVALFDAIFDPFRPDIGKGGPLSSADFGPQGLVVPMEAPGCPATDRAGQATCAIWVIGNMIGTTVSHEIGHSLGLANPSSPASFHNGSDGLNRLMDSGSARPFAERAQLNDQGPGRFCLEAYEYLRDILPSSDLPDFETRVSCF